MGMDYEIRNFPNLFRSIQVGALPLKNRIIMPAMGTLYATWNGEVTPRMLAYYGERARGGVGLIVVEYAYVHRSGQVYLGQLAVDRDDAIKGLRKLARAIKDGGAAAALQIFHGGRLSFPAATGCVPLAPSSIASVGGILPKEITHREIESLQQDFAAAASRVKAAGFDAVEIHMGHGYLLHSFLTPLANQRQDEYGGALSNRARFALEVLGKVRAEVGDDFPILCKISGSDYAEGGLTTAEVQTFTQWLEKSGTNLITVSGGYKNETDHMVTPPMSLPRGFRAPLAQQIKSVLSIPVASVGRINEPSTAEKIIQGGQADMVAVGRALIADPKWPKKAAEGLIHTIRHCISCNQECIGRIMSGLPISCLANPEAGREDQFRGKMAPVKKKVVVIGAGPGGLSCSIALAERGHQVTLLEEKHELGGRMATAALPPYKEEIAFLVSHMISEVNRRQVSIQSGVKDSVAIVREAKPDLVVIACGAKPLAPENFTPGQNNFLWADDVLKAPSLVGKRVAIIGGGMVGLETAEFLVEHGRDVIVLEMTDQLAPDLNERTRKLLLERIWPRQVEILLQAKFKDYLCAKKQLVIERKGILEQINEIDTVVLAMGYKEETTTLLTALQGMNISIKVIGDALKPRSAAEAIREGFELAYSI